MNNDLVTVFGGSGFLGRHTVRALARAGWRIRVATRHPNSAFFLRPLGSVGQIDLVKCDVTDPDQVARAMQGARAVVNLCGILFQSGQTFEEVQGEGADHVAQAANAAGVSALVHVSAADRRRTHPLPAGLCRRCGAGDRRGAGPPGWPHL
jgi:uncharacterized protein YbjT (DUF2867 family)